MSSPIFIEVRDKRGSSICLCVNHIIGFCSVMITETNNGVEQEYEGTQIRTIDGQSTHTKDTYGEIHEKITDAISASQYTEQGL